MPNRTVFGQPTASADFTLSVEVHAVQRQIERTTSIRAVDEAGNYYDVDHFIEYLINAAQESGDLRPIRSVRVNRQAAKQLDDSTYEVVATGLKLRRVSRIPQPPG